MGGGEWCEWGVRLGRGGGERLGWGKYPSRSQCLGCACVGQVCLSLFKDHDQQRHRVRRRLHGARGGVGKGGPP